MSTSERMLRLLSLLQTHRYWPGPELAGRLGVSERTLRRDVDRLRDLGYDVDAARGVAGGYQLRAGKALPPLLLDDDEAVAIAVGLRSSAASAIDGGGDAAVSALTKVMGMLPPTLRNRLDALRSVNMPPQYRTSTAIDTGTLTTLAAACRDGEIVRFGYTAHAGESTDRRVEPHELVSYGQRWYLVGFDLARTDWRTFRLDRIEDIRVFGGRFTPRDIPGGSGFEYVRNGRRNVPRRHQVEIRFAAPLETVRASTGSWGELRPDDADGQVTYWTLATDSLDWPVMLIAQIDAPATVASPPELAEMVRAAGRRMLTC